MALDIDSLPENIQVYLKEAKQVFSKDKYEQKCKDLEIMLSNLPEYMRNNLHFVMSPQEELEQELQNANDDEGIETRSLKPIAEILDSQYDDNLELWFDLSENVNSKELENGYEALDEAEKLIFLIDGFEREVNNGGLAQFFSNSIGTKSYDLLRVLEILEANKTHALFKTAVGVFQPENEHSKNIEIEAGLNKKKRADLEKMEKQYFDDYQDLATKVIDYLKQNLNK